MGTSPFFFRRIKMLNRGLDKLELLRIVDAVANEKSIDKDIVIRSMESAIQKAALTKFGHNNNILVKIDRETGNTFYGKVPAYSVVVPGSMPSKNNPNGPSLYCVVIVKKVDQKTRSKTSINDLLRD